jgi:nicotinamide-nucleotide amidase
MDAARLNELWHLAERVGEALRRRGETVAVAESSAGGLVSAALLALPGASAYFRGGAAVYTGDAKERFLGVSRDALADPRAATEGHAMVLARGACARLGATWGLGETGAAGPTGNRYGDPAGHTCLGVTGPNERAATLKTGRAERGANMVEFAIAALRLLDEAIGATER